MGAGAAIAAGVAVAGVAGAVISSGAAKDAASTQAAAADRASALQHDQYVQTRSDLAPFVQTGQSAFNRLGTIFGLNSGASGGGGGGGFAPAAPAAAQGPQNTFGTPLSFFPSGQNIPAPTGGGLPQGWAVIPYDTGNAPPTQNVVDENGNFVRSFPANASAADIASSMGFSLTGQPAQPAPAPQGGGAPNPQTSADALAAYGLPGLTYDPSRYGLGNGVFDPAAYGLGNGTFDPAAYGLGNGTFQPTQAGLEATPGYQFTLSQGLKSVQNSATSRGQGISGAALKGAATFATGQADNTLRTQADIYNQNLRTRADVYNQNLTNARGTYAGNLGATQGIFQKNLENVINPLFSYSQLGANAGAQVGGIGASIVNSQSNLLTGSANAQAAGMIGSANALSSGINSVGQAPMNYLLYNKLLNSSGGGTPGATYYNGAYSQGADGALYGSGGIF